MTDINLTGVGRTLKAAVPAMLEAGNGGSIIVTGSVAARKHMENLSHYVAAKSGIAGLAMSMANELGPSKIRVNVVLPGNVRTPMITT